MKIRQPNIKKKEPTYYSGKNAKKTEISVKNKQKFNVYKRILIISVLLISIAVSIISVITFFKTGRSGYTVTVSFYIMILSALLVVSIKNKIVKFNLLLFFFLLFCTESYLRISKKGFLDYMERNSTSIFAGYLSKYYEYSGIRDGIYWLHSPNCSYTDKKPEYTQDYKCNEIGLRERPLNEFKNNAFNILILGDSFTEGVGCPQEQNTPSVIESDLYNNYKKKDVKVINGGVCGSDLFFNYKLMEKLYKDIKPKVVILNINTSDIDDIVCRGGEERFNGNKVKYVNNSPWWEYPYSFSYIFRTVTNTIFQTNPVTYCYERNKKINHLEIIYNKILKYKDYCDKRNIQFVLVASPILAELQNNNFSYDKLLEEINNQTKIKTINLKQFFLQKNYKTNTNYAEYYYLQDYHFKPEGYKLVGNIISSEINKYCN